MHSLCVHCVFELSEFTSHVTLVVRLEPLVLEARQRRADNKRHEQQAVCQAVVAHGSAVADGHEHEALVLVDLGAPEEHVVH